MTYRIRSWVGEQPLPALDVTTDAAHVAVDEARARARAYGWEDVSVAIAGARTLKGENLRAWVQEMTP